MGSRVSNSWIRRPQGIAPGSDVYDCADIYPTRAALLRGRDGDKTCRFRSETFNHLLTLSPALKGLITRRQDRNVNLLASKCVELGWRVRKEYRCRLDGGRTVVPT
ncbi:retrovirus-related Pol polyprotein from type-1 retrotransposable element R2 [Caerostris darwini]|uniref:Retrovirus-related Pol polyprotein from type-1 retrotransposable element R2 n=1 Tax=Caerostris darwini TaxID=1538125 RepID=A0AAV4ME05_9ARAC|nr:retrovirus-related Pol polyprotein from type-1 retrotransposable element R2 [Caerostris darwini]